MEESVAMTEARRYGAVRTAAAEEDQCESAAVPDSQWEQTANVVAVEHRQRVERLQEIPAARELKAELEGVGQKKSAAEQPREVLKHAEKAA